MINVWRNIITALCDINFHFVSQQSDKFTNLILTLRTLCIRSRCYRLQFRARYLHAYLRLLVFILILTGEQYLLTRTRSCTRPCGTHTHTAVRLSPRAYTRQRCETMTMRMCPCIHAYMRVNGAYACVYVVSVAAVRQVRGTVDQSEASP